MQDYLPSRNETDGARKFRRRRCYRPTWKVQVDLIGPTPRSISAAERTQLHRAFCLVAEQARGRTGKGAKKPDTAEQSGHKPRRFCCLTQLGANVQRTLQFGCINVRPFWDVHGTFV